jgi:hypothetical protein
MILIAAERHDVHARRVKQLLEDRDRVVRLFHATEFGPSQRLTFDPISGHGMIRGGDGLTFHTSDVTAVWYRRPGRTVADPGITDSLDRSFAENEWQFALDGFFSAMPVPVISPPLRQRAAIKPRQLAAASAAGLRVPKTLITSDAEEAVAFVRSHSRVIHKAMSSPPHRLLDTREWSAFEESRLDDLALSPIVLQEMIEGPSDLRVTVVGQQLFTAEIHGTPRYRGPDSRLDLDAPCNPYHLSDDVSHAILRVMETLGLAFGTVDLKRTWDGDFVFFEVNPQGQFLYIEIRTAQQISAAVADLLMAA